KPAASARTLISVASGRLLAVRGSSVRALPAVPAGATSLLRFDAVVDGAGPGAVVVDGAGLLFDIWPFSSTRPTSETFMCSMSAELSLVASTLWCVAFAMVIAWLFG